MNKDQTMKRTVVRLTRGKMAELTSGVFGHDETSSCRTGGDDEGARLRHFKQENIKLQESVLNRLWNSLPPEKRILGNLDDEDSDATESGLDEDEEEDGGNLDENEKVLSKKGRKQSKNDEIENTTTQSLQIFESDSSPDEEDESFTSWDINFDFIQAIIWLKSTTLRLQRVPADDVLKVFKNQWVFSQDIKSSQALGGNETIKKRDSSSSGTAPIVRNRLKDLKDSSSGYLIETKQLEHAALIRDRLTAYNNSNRNGPDVVIPESDESETSSLESSQTMPVRVYPVLDFTELNSAVDSGFNSEKPESVDINTTENFKSVNFRQREKSRTLNDIDRGVESETSGRENRKMKRKHSGASKTTSTSKRPRLTVSSATLNNVLRNSECNKLLITSVRAILNGLKGIESTASSLRINWHGSVQKEGTKAVVSVVDQLQKEKGSNSCRDEAVATVRRVLENMLHDNEGDKRTTWEHHRLLILELCEASSVCTEVVNYLISELEKLIPVVRQTSEKNMRTSLGILDKSYLLFHSLRIVLTKYVTFAPISASSDERNSSKKIPDITEFWKRHLPVKEKESDVFVTGLKRLENEDRKEGWIRVLEELVVASTISWPMVKVLAWQCLTLVKSSNLSSGER